VIDVLHLFISRPPNALRNSQANYLQGRKRARIQGSQAQQPEGLENVFKTAILNAIIPKPKHCTTSMQAKKEQETRIDNKREHVSA